MLKRTLFWHLVPSYVALALVAVLAVGWLAIRQLERHSLSATRAYLQSQADFLDQQMGPDILADRAEFARLSRRLAESGNLRIALLLPDGKVDSDSRNRLDELQNQLERPEINRALRGEANDAVRFNRALDARVIYRAVPVMRLDQLAGVLYLSASLAPLDQSLQQLELGLLAVGLLIVAGALTLAWRVSHGIAVPLGQFSQVAARLARGEWSARGPIPDARETAELGESINQLAEQLQQRIGVITRQNSEQKAVLASMAEGVLAVDSQQRVISSNTASGRLLGLDSVQIQGRPLSEVVRNADLNRFISRALGCADPIEADVLLHGDRERVLQARGSALHDLEGRPIGVVVVLNDVTDFRRLEHIRRDFVANVSHELKTPVTSIKGFVETLLDGAMHDPPDTERFLRIVAKQADRLHAVIEDLLSLSKIEQSEDHDDIVLEPTAVRGVLETALGICQAPAGEHQIEVRLDCDPQLQVPLNAPLMEQALVNLLDNAIKYSEPGKQVQIRAQAIDGQVTITVQDHGVGIASEHVARIFERFYRVDRARSRKLGGTGLGLAIVKHIVQAHRGRVTVDSTPGAGSTFTIHLPRGPVE